MTSFNTSYTFSNLKHKDILDILSRSHGVMVRVALNNLTF